MLVRKDAQNRADKFYETKVNSLNLSYKLFHKDYMQLLKTKLLLFLDTETTGLEVTDRIWQISIRVVKNYKEIDHLYETFTPWNNFPTPIPTSGRLPLEKINLFLQKYSDGIVIAHNISFDVPHCEDEGIKFPETMYFFDTMWLYNTQLKSLGKICYYNKVQVDPGKQHNAGYDTMILRDAVIYWLQHYIKGIHFANPDYLWRIVMYLKDPSKYTNPCKKETWKKIDKPDYDCYKELEQMGYTVYNEKKKMNECDSYYKVVVTKTKCALEYNYQGIEAMRSGSTITMSSTDGLPQPSDEQMAIVNAIATNNVTVDAVAGSGKTTTAMFIAKTYPDKKILMLTYNKQLQMDNTQRCKHLTNMEIYTMHAYCGQLYKGGCFTDRDMYRLIEKKPNKQLDYDIIIIDEAQDMIELYYKFVLVIDSICKEHTLCLIGDKYQNIYHFNGATTKYLENPEEYFNRPFEHLTLLTSYRLTNQMADWINNDVMHKNRLRTCKEGPPVNVVFSKSARWSAKRAATHFSKMIINLKNNGIDPSDIMFLSHSVKSSSISSFIKDIKKGTDFDVYVPQSDDTPLSKECSKGKILFSSIHQSKGIERDYVFLYRFDTGYCYATKQYLRELNNLFYVGLTRAKKMLTVFIRDIDVNGMICEPFPFMSLEDRPYVKYYEKDKITVGKFDETQLTSKSASSVTELCKFIKASDELELEKLMKVEVLETDRIDCDIPTVVNKEEVADISGRAIGAYIALQQGKSSSPFVSANLSNILAKVKKNSLNNVFTMNRLQKCDVSNLNDDFYNMSISQLLKMYTFGDFASLGFVHKPLQLGNTNFDWIDEKELDLMVRTLQSNFTANNLTLAGLYEYPFTGSMDNLQGKKLWRKKYDITVDNDVTGIYGNADLVTEDNDVIEFKMVNELTFAHKCQLLLYAFMNNTLSGILYNIKTGEMLRITCENEEKFMNIFLKEKNM